MTYITFSIEEINISDDTLLNLAKRIQQICIDEFNLDVALDNIQE